MLLFALLLAASEMTVPPSVVDIKYDHGIVVLVEQHQGGYIIRMRKPDGTELRSIQPAEAMKRGSLYDVAVTESGELAVSLSSPGTLGPAENQIAVWTAGSLTRQIDLGPVACHKLAADGDAGFWCLGPDVTRLGTGRDYPILHYFTAQGLPAGQYLSRNAFPRDGLDGERAPEPSAAGDVGLPQVLAPAPQRALAWVPLGDSLVLVNQKDGKVSKGTVGIRGEGRALITVTAASGAIYAMLPQRGELPEGFLTPYRIFRRDTTAWTLLEGMNAWPRGSLLIGADPDGLAVWVRPRQRVYFLPVFK